MRKFWTSKHVRSCILDGRLLMALDSQHSSKHKRYYVDFAFLGSAQCSVTITKAQNISFEISHAAEVEVVSYKFCKIRRPY